MLKVKVRWSGFTGSPGWSNFYFDDATEPTFETDEQAVAVAGKVKDFFTALRSYYTGALNWSIQSDVEVISADDGAMIAVKNIGPQAIISGLAVAGPHSGASGVVVTWRTNAVKNRRRVRGRTFLVPAANSAYGNDGTLDTTAQGTFQTAANNLITPVTGIQLGVWSRPTLPGATDGAFHPVVAASVPDKAAILRSRRD